jgi:ubiquinone/menaquinone biosynthesis C-methylase UbiE
LLIDRIYGLNGESRVHPACKPTGRACQTAAKMAPSPLLLTLLADPLDYTPVRWDEETKTLRSSISGRTWPLRNGVPLFAAEDAARYDGVSAWYDSAMQEGGSRGALSEAAFAMLSGLIGTGGGVAVDVGCGTGLSAPYVRRQGYDPVGVDLSLDMLTQAAERLPAAQGNATRLPLRSACAALAYSTFTTTDWDDLEGAVKEVSRILKPGGRYVSVAVHPCFNGSHAEVLPSGEVLQKPGYATAQYRQPSSHQSPVRGKVGAWHRPVSGLLNAFAQAGLRINLVREGGPGALPDLIAISASKPSGIEPSGIEPSRSLA